MIFNFDRIFQKTTLKSRYLQDAVLNETLRHHPPIVAGVRTIADDVTVTGYRVPKHTRTQVSQHALQHHPKYWHQPETFNPDRLFSCMPG